MNLSEIVKQLESCEYTCEAGTLENNIAFQVLRRMSRPSKYERSVDHIRQVQFYLVGCIQNLQHRLLTHDDSKLHEPERSAYEGVDEAVAPFPFGSDEYRQAIKNHLGDALAHHYRHNPHHPSHYEDGVQGMSLFDLIEMLADLRAVCDDKGKEAIDLEVNKKNDNISDSVYEILLNTIKEMGW